MRLAERGMRLDRVFVVRNTLDMDAQRRLRDELAGIADAGLRARLGLRADSVVLLYVGRVYRAKRVPELARGGGGHPSDRPARRGAGGGDRR